PGKSPFETRRRFGRKVAPGKGSSRCAYGVCKGSIEAVAQGRPAPKGKNELATGPGVRALRGGKQYEIHIGIGIGGDAAGVGRRDVFRRSGQGSHRRRLL